MADEPKDQENQEEAAAPDKPKGVSIGSILLGMLKAIGSFLPRLGLYLFMIIIPLIITGYPAYLVASRLVDYSAAKIVEEAEFTAIDIKRVRHADDGSLFFKSKGHTEVTLFFKTGPGERYFSVLEMPWVAPGLRREMNEQYQAGDLFTLYLLPDEEVVTDEEMTKDSLIRLTSLMGLIFIASVLLVLIRIRLSATVSDILPAASTATANSIIFGQLITLMIAAALTAVVTFQPIFVPNILILYLGAYWGIAALLSLSLRLLLFENPPPEPVPEKSDDSKADKPR